MKKTLIAAIVAMSISAAALAGCGSGAGSAEASASASSSAAEAEAGAVSGEAAAAGTEMAAQTAAENAGAAESGANDYAAQEAEWKADFLQKASEAGYPADAVSAEALTDNDDWYCAVFSTDGGGLDSNGFYGYYVYDKKTSRTVTLKDVCGSDPDYIKAVSDEIIRQMKDRKAKDENMSYFIESDMPEDDFKEISDQQMFYITAEGTLVICFNEGQVAPMYMGAQAFEIPASVAAPKA